MSGFIYLFYLLIYLAFPLGKRRQATPHIAAARETRENKQLRAEEKNSRNENEDRRPCATPRHGESKRKKKGRKRREPTRREGRE